MLKQKIEQIVVKAIESLGLPITDEMYAKITITYPDPKMGDYSTNAALILAKLAGKSPGEVAKQIASKIDSFQFDKIEVAGPGFINLTLKPEIIVEQMKNPI